MRCFMREMTKPTDLRKIDALIAEHVFNFDVVNGKVADDFGNTGEPFSYSTSIADAWLVMTHMELKDFNCYVKTIYPEFIVGITEEEPPRWKVGVNYHEAASDSAPLAICLAALKALGVEVKEENGK